MKKDAFLGAKIEKWLLQDLKGEAELKNNGMQVM